MWIIYFIHGCFFHFICWLTTNVCILNVYADLAYEKGKFIDEIDEDIVIREMERRMDYNG